MIVKIENVTKRYGAVTALKSTNLDIREGSFFALLGPSGCGKTTLLRMIGGFEYPDSGHIWIDGKDTAEMTANQRPVNMVFQSYAVFPHMCVADNIAYGLKVTGVPPGEIAAKVADGIAMTSLDGLEDRMPGQLSGGQRQRVALARALVKRPKVLLLDEPLSALDKKLREAMQSELVRLQREVGITFVMVTHDQSEALAVADQIAVINAGEVVQVDDPRMLYEHPRTRFVASFIGTSNFFEARVRRRDGGRVLVEAGALGNIEVAETSETPADNGWLMVRPEKLRLSFDQLDDRPDQLCLSAKLEQMTYQGGSSIAQVRLADGTAIQCTQVNAERGLPPTPKAGSPCRIAIDLADLLFLGD